jgi:hypothetical protein
MVQQATSKKIDVCIRPESLEPFCRPYTDFSPAEKVSRDERGSNHDGHGHKKDVQITVKIHYNTSRHEPNASWRGG